MLHQKERNVGVRLPQELYNDCEKAVREGRYLNISDLIRASLRKEIYQDGQPEKLTRLERDKRVQEIAGDKE